MKFNTVVFTTIAVFLTVSLLPRVMTASGGDGAGNTPGGSEADYIYYLLVK